MMSRLAAFLAILCALAGPAHAQVATIGQGATPAHYFSTASTNSTLIRTGPATLYSMIVANNTVVLYYLKFYDKATQPICGTDTPVHTIPVPFGASSAGGGFISSLPVGINFNLGMGFCITGGLADNDNTNAATGVVLNVTYK
jgi:hypothetical protein